MQRIQGTITGRLDGIDSLSSAVRLMRTARGLTTEEAGELFSLTKQAYALWETRTLTTDRLATLCRLCNAAITVQPTGCFSLEFMAAPAEAA